MQKNQDCIVLVHVDFLLQENLLENLRLYVSKLDFNEIKSYDEFSYDLDKEEVVIVREPPHPDYSNLNLISTKSNRGCIITNIKTLKKLLKLDES